MTDFGEKYNIDFAIPSNWARLCCLVGLIGILATGVPILAQPISNAQKVSLAKQTGGWTVDAGEYLYGICRLLIGGAGLGSCVEDIHASNPRAFFNGDASRLIPGARLEIPSSVRKAMSSVALKPPPISQPRPPTALSQTPDTTITVPAAVAPVPRSVVSPQLTTYRDTLINDGVATADPVEIAGRGWSSEPGQKFVSVEYAVDINEPQGRRRATDQSVALQFRRETENWGEWFVDAAGMHSSGTQDVFMASRRSGGRATLYQNAFPITERWIADSALGVIRNPLNPLVLNSFRITLPSPLYAGLSTQLRDVSGATEFRFAAGDIGVLQGLSGSAFDATRGQFASAGANLRLGERWIVGLQTLQIRDVFAQPDHSSVAAAVLHDLPGLAGKLSFHALADSKGRRGAWTDADLNWAQTRHRIGAYQLDPDLLWADAQIANDQRGFYWRADQRGLRRSLFGGVNYSDSNLDRIASRGGQRSVDGFFGLTFRPGRNLSYGGTLSLQTIAPHRADSARSEVASGSGFVGWMGAFGASRLDMARYLVRPELSASEFVDTVGVSHDWPSIKGYAITSAVNASREHGIIDTTRRQSFNLAVRSPTMSDFHWDVALTLARVDNARGAEKNANASAAAYWQVSPNWQASTQFVWNTIDPAPPLQGTVLEAFKRDKRLLFTLRYERASGTPFASLGLGRQGLSGSGRISGIVFFDENGDGIRQANERGAPNLTVFLDGRIPATTDSAGRYSFASVPTGTHTLVLLADTLPLPWIQEDEKGLKALVELRGEVIQDIPLIRLRP